MRCRVDDEALADAAKLGGFHFSGAGGGLDVDAVALFLRERDEGDGFQPASPLPRPPGAK
jgi:hypothetical protein